MSPHLRFGRRAFRRHLFQVSLLLSLPSPELIAFLRNLYRKCLVSAAVLFITLFSDKNCASFFFFFFSPPFAGAKMIDLSRLTLIREEIEKQIAVLTLCTDGMSFTQVTWR